MTSLKGGRGSQREIMEDTMNNLPDRMTFEELISHPLYKNYVENGLPGETFRWQVLLLSGWWYSSDPANTEIGIKCSALEKLDPVTF